MGARLPEAPKLRVWATKVLFKEPELSGHLNMVFSFASNLSDDFMKLVKTSFTQ